MNVLKRSFAGVIFLIGSAQISYAENLQNALVSAYQTNPSLAASFAAFKAASEAKAQATAAWLPTAGISSSYTQQAVQARSLAERYGDTNAQGLTINQNIYNGGANSAGNAQADASVKQAQFKYYVEEQKFLTDIIGIYLGVLLAQEKLTLAESNQELLEKIHEQTEARFELGDVTRTDLAQVESELAGAQAAKLKTQAELENARTTYLAAVGHMPEKLEFPEAPSPLPTDLKTAQILAFEKNPGYLQAQYDEKSSQHGIEVQDASFSPKIDLSLKFERSETIHPKQSQSQGQTLSGAATVSLSIPLNLSGGAQSQLRYARQIASQKKLAVMGARRSLENAVSQAIENLKVAQEQVPLTEEQVRASEVVLEGMKLEEELGNRTMTDVLKAEKDCYQSKVGLLSAKVGSVQSSYELLSVVGDLTVKKLGLPIAANDPQAQISAIEDAPYDSRKTVLDPNSTQEVAEADDERVNP